MSIEAAIMFSLVGCAVCAAKAGEKERSVAAWAVLGFLFPLIAVIAISGAKSLAPRQPANDDYYDYR